MSQYRAGLADGARGRGSRRRYRLAVLAEVARWARLEAVHLERAGACRRWAGAYTAAQRRGPFRMQFAGYTEDAEMAERQATLCGAAARRCGRILAALDEVTR